MIPWCIRLIEDRAGILIPEQVDAVIDPTLPNPAQRQTTEHLCEPVVVMKFDICPNRPLMHEATLG